VKLSFWKKHFDVEQEKVKKKIYVKYCIKGLKQIWMFEILGMLW
jgi:hypothetical protein